MAIPKPRAAFAFREYEAGPRRDVAQKFYMLVDDLSWLADGPEKDEFLAKLKEARDSALVVAQTMLK